MKKTLAIILEICVLFGTVVLAATLVPQDPPVQEQAPQSLGTTDAKPSAPAAKPAPKARKRKPGSTASASKTPAKRVVKDGGTAEPTAQLSPSMSEDQASHSRQTTAQLLNATDSNLKEAANRTLNATQQEMVTQIRKYMEQANSALTAGDLQRGHNLALKAHMLSDDLLKH